MNETEDGYELSPEKIENIIQKGIQLIDNMILLSNKKVKLTEEAYFSEVLMNFQELVMTTQNFTGNSSDHKSLGDILMSAITHYLKLYDVRVDDPGQAIQLIR